MPKYLFKASLTPEGVRGTLKEGGVSRRENLEGAVKRLSGSVEAFYYAFGETDAFVIVDLPDNETAAALALAVAETGAIGVSTTVLLTPEEVDGAIAKKVAFRPPGA